MTKIAAAATALVLASIAAPSGASAGEGDDRFLVGFKAAPGESERELVRARGARVRYRFPEVRAVAIAARPAEAAALGRARGVTYVEEDPRREASGLADSELSPSLSNGLYGLIRTKATDAHGAGVTGAGSKVCVADTGIDADHPDIAANYQGGTDLVSDDGDPDVGNSSAERHGTHVAGTATAALTTAGVRGVAYDADLFHARVLGPSGSGSTSDVMAGVRHLVEQRGCKVVNLSLGGGLKSATEEAFYEEMYRDGALIVAAAGNGGRNRLDYPGGYTVVLSVGAVDANNAHASFSNTGGDLDISGPGVGVLSSVPGGTGSEAAVQTSESFRAFGLEFAGLTDGLAKTLVDSGSGNTAAEFPAEVVGGVALMRRGGASFATKVQNAMDAGAVAAVIYNDATGDFTGTLGTPTAAGGAPWIPAVSVSDATGATLESQAGAQATVVNKVSHWDHLDGTSMATPHVSGVAALVFSADDAQTNGDVEAKLKSSATDLGAPGHDGTFGHGLVNADAYKESTGDVTPPDTAVTSGPSGATNQDQATLSFSSSEPGSTFECRLDGSAWESCDSPTSYSGLDDGGHDFEVRATDGADNTDPTPAGRSWMVDTSSPAATAPEQSFVTDSRLGTTQIPIQLAWSGSDDETPQSQLEYELEVDVDSSGAFSALGKLGDTQVSAPFPPDRAYEFRVRARDQAGNRSPFAKGPEFDVKAYQDGSSRLDYAGDWRKRASSGAYGGTVRSSDERGDKATFALAGRNVGVVMPRKDELGTVQVCLDHGTPAQDCDTVDLSPSSGLASRKIVWRRNALDPSEPHAVRVKVLSGRADLDALVLLR